MPPSPPRPYRTARPGPGRASGPAALSADPRPARVRRPGVLVRVHAAQDRGRGSPALAGDPAARAAAAHLRLGDLRGRRVDQGPDRPGHRPDRRGDHADPGRPLHRGEPLGGRAEAGDRVLCGGGGAQRARAARRPARRPERRLGPAPRRAELRGGAGPADQVGRRLLRRGGRVPGEAPALARSRDGRAPLRGQVPGRGGLRHHQHVLLPRGLPAAAGPGRGGRAATCRSSRASCRSPACG